MLLAEQDDAVGICAFEIVVHSPAVGGFGEFLVVNDDEHGFEAGGNAAGKNRFFEFSFSAMDFAN